MDMCWVCGVIVLVFAMQMVLAYNLVEFTWNWGPVTFRRVVGFFLSWNVHPTLIPAWNLEHIAFFLVLQLL